MLAGRIIAGPHVRNACRRHLNDMKTRVERGLLWDRVAMWDALDFFPICLKLIGGQFEGEPFELDDHQKFIIGSIFGWKWKRTRQRRYRRAYIEEGKGNGKSPLAAGVGLYGMIADGELRAEIYAAASKRDQAMIMFRDAVAMVDQSPELYEVIVQSGVNPVWQLAHLESGSFFKPISSEEGQSGPRPHIALCDEVHEHRDGHVIDMLERGFKFRRNPLIFMITNSGSDRNSACYAEHQHAVKVAAGDMKDDTTFSYVCALDEDEEPLDDPSCWIKANPLLGKAIEHDYLAGVVDQAKKIPGKMNAILRLHFCVWTDAEEAWLPAATWRECELPEFDLGQFVGEQVWFGLDLSSAKDLTALSGTFRTGDVPIETEDGEEKMVPSYLQWSEFWTPGDTLDEREKIDKAPYRQWCDDGYLHAPPGRLIRFDHVAHRLAELSEMFEIVALAYDRYLFPRVEMEMDELGLDIPIIEHPQGWSKRRDTELWMPQSINEMEAAILEGRFQVEMNPVMRWCVTSAVFETSAAGLRRFTKRKATGRIDGAVSGAMSIGAASAETLNSKKGSVYDDDNTII